MCRETLWPATVYPFALCRISIFTPDFSPGCRRATPGVSYHKAIQEDNVDVIRSGVQRMTETGLVDMDGTHREYDAVIFATGYNT